MSMSMTRLVRRVLDFAVNLLERARIIVVLAVWVQLNIEALVHVRLDHRLWITKKFRRSGHLSRWDLNIYATARGHDCHNLSLLPQTSPNVVDDTILCALHIQKYSLTVVKGEES